jgi:type II secretory pathway pseudopilin PulG
MLRRARAEEGETLMELLIAIAIASVVLFALLQVFVGTLQADARTEDRVAATASVRLGMERVVSALDSQVCADAVTPPIVAGSTGSALTYFSDRQAPSATATPTPDGAHRERLTYYAQDDQATGAKAGSIVLDRWAGTAATGTPTRTTLAQGVAAPAGGPFRFFGYNDTSSGAAPVAETEVGSGGAALAASDVGAIVRVRVLLQGATPRGAKTTTTAQMEGDAYVGSLDPVQPGLGARCAA